jgi:hypothetical protein
MALSIYLLIYRDRSRYHKDSSCAHYVDINISNLMPPYHHLSLEISVVARDLDALVV